MIITQYNSFETKYKPGDILVQASSGDTPNEEFEIEAIIVRKNEIVYDLYFMTIPVELVDNAPLLVTQRMKLADPDTHAHIVGVLIVQQSLCLMDDEVKWWCGCGDLVDLDEECWVKHGKCLNCVPFEDVETSHQSQIG